MEQQVTNFARFYSILKRVPKIGDDEFFKKEMVYIATGGRTESLKSSVFFLMNSMILLITSSIITWFDKLLSCIDTT